LTSTSGGLPGEKKRSLIFGALRNMAVSNEGVENGAGAGALAGAAAPALAVVLAGFGVVAVTPLDICHVLPSRIRRKPRSTAISVKESLPGLHCRTLIRQLIRTFNS